MPFGYMLQICNTCGENATSIGVPPLVAFNFFIYKQSRPRGQNCSLQTGNMQEWQYVDPGKENRHIILNMLMKSTCQGQGRFPPDI